MRIDVNNLSCGYNNKSVIRDIDFTIGRKELWCVLGANGAGKTTFFKTLLNLIKPVSGMIFFDGIPMNKWNRKELARQIAYVPQHHVPPFPFLVEDIVLMGRNPYQKGMGKMNAQDREAVDQALSILGIEYLRGAVYTKISGGERQLVLLARAIAQDTPVLVLDEPVSNLDFGNQARVMTHICNLINKTNRTIIMTTHFPDHGFLENANVLLLHKTGLHSIGKGSTVITENAVQALYDIDNKIVTIEPCGKTICVPMYRL